MTCHEYDALLARDLEGDLSPEERRSADAHLLDCGRCTALRAELVDIATAAAALPAISPSRDLWDGIAARIEAPVIALGAQSEPGTARRRSWRFAAAAAALVVATAGTTYVITSATFNARQPQLADAGPPATDPGNDASSTASGGTLVSATRTSSDAAYDREVVQLRALLEQRRPDLDSATVALLERNLRIIDQAIAESRAALAKDPGSALLNRQLHSALGKRVQVLRTAALLPVGTN
jgi:hypothetical protein